MGKVLLVGAGPGDPDLLTVKALKALQQADAVLFDDLVTPEVLALARPGATRIGVGKRAGRDSCSQSKINTMMVALAQAGRLVVRLKSGDPSVFGRSGEEIAELVKAGVAFEVVPGITAGSALAAELGVSLTHRDYAQSVRFVTAHGAGGDLPEDLDWRGLSNASTTLVVYMGRRTGPRFAEQLISEGRAEAVPVIVAANISRPGHQIVSGTLSQLALGHLCPNSDGPALIVIGEAVGAARNIGQIAGEFSSRDGKASSNSAG